jgi:hypothetical protein
VPKIFFCSVTVLIETLKARFVNAKFRKREGEDGWRGPG